MLSKIFFDADALIAGSASKAGSSFILLQLCELNILHGLSSSQVVEECRVNIQKKLPEAEHIFEQIVERSLEVLENPNPGEIEKFNNMSHPKDLPILVTAILSKADYLVTFNTKHFRPDPNFGLTVIKPGDLFHKIRLILNQLHEKPVNQ